MRSRLAGTILVALALSCSSPSKPPPPPLDLAERLPAGKARAGRIARPDELVGGPLARGKVGDYKIYNSKVAFVIEDAGTASGYSPYGGKILDADRVRAPGEAGGSRFGEWIAGFDERLCNAQRVTVVSDGSQGGAAVVRAEGPDGPIPLLDAILEGILRPRDRQAWITIDYVLEPDADFLRVELTLENRAADAQDFRVRHGLLMGDGAQPWQPGGGFETGLGEYRYYAALADDVSYGVFEESPLAFIISQNGILIASQPTSFTVTPRERKTVRLVLAVGAGDTGSLERAWRVATGQAQTGVALEGRVEDGAGAAVAGARVHAVQLFDGGARSYAAVAVSASDGTYRLALPPGSYELRATAAELPPSEAAAVTLDALPAAVVAPVGAPTLRLGATGRLRFQVKDEAGRALPAKITVRSLGASIPALPRGFGTRRYNGGAARVVYAHGGSGEVPLRPGRYRVIASRGFEYEIAEREVEIGAGAALDTAFALARVVDTRGYLCGDFHLHAQKSPDSDDLDEEKVAAFAAEGLEVPVSTDHEFIADYAPAIDRLGLGGFVRSIIGQEVTTMHIGHFNAFPLALDPRARNQGYVPWYSKKGPELFALIRSNAGGPVIQVNHPRSTGAGGYFSAVGMEPVTGTVERLDEWSDDFDAIEVVNGRNLWGVTDGVFRDWYNLLNRGKRSAATGNSDSHGIYWSEVGYPRNYVRVDTDDLAAFDPRTFVEGVRAGRLVVSGGAFLTAAVAGKGPGETATVSGGQVFVDIVVQAPPWVDVDRLVIVGNGEEVHARELSPADADPANAVVRFRGSIPLAPERDSWYVVHVRGTRALDPVVPGARPFAFTNPIFVDVDGNGRFDAPGG